MRLLYVCSDFGIAPSGTKGASIHLRAITRALADLGHEVLLLSPQDGPDEDHPAKRLLPPGCPAVKKTAKSLKHWLLDHDFDETVAKELRPLLYNTWAPERALEALDGAAPAAIVERLSLFGHVGLDLAEALNVPFIVEVNALLTRESREFRNLELGRLADAIEQRVLRRADAVMAVSAPLVERIVELGVDRERVHVVPNGVDLQAFAAAPNRSICRGALGLTDEFVVGFCGSLKVWHGVDVLLEAFYEFRQHDPSARLLIVGTGPSEPELRRAAREYNMNGAVIFTGAVEHERVPALLRAMDVAVAPFKAMEDFYFSPIKLFEYMASETCVIATRLGQIREVIADGVNGLLCRPDYAGGLCQALVRARTSAHLRQQLADAALQTVRERYTWQRAAEDVARIIGAARGRAKKHAHTAEGST